MRLDLRSSLEEEGRCLFAERVPISIEEEGTLKRTQMLAELRVVGGEYTSSAFKLVLSNDQDSFMLYTLIIDANAFTAVKENQRLLVNFEAFPKKLIEMLRACIEGRLVACGLVDGLDLLLQINERNQFRELTHLVLNFSRAEESLLRRHLAEKLQQLRVRLRGLSD